MKLADILLQLIPYNPLPRYLTEYQPGITPLSDTTPVVATLIAYFLAIFSIRWFMQDKAPLNLTSFFQSHNLFLTTISSLLAYPHCGGNSPHLVEDRLLQHDMPPEIMDGGTVPLGALSESSLLLMSRLLTLTAAGILLYG